MSKPRTRSNVTKKKPRWVHLAAANAPDPRINRDDPEYGKRTVLAVFGVDSLGRTFRLDEDLRVVMPGTPPPVNDDGA